MAYIYLLSRRHLAQTQQCRRHHRTVLPQYHTLHTFTLYISHHYSWIPCLSGGRKPSPEQSVTHRHSSSDSVFRNRLKTYLFSRFGSPSNTISNVYSSIIGDWLSPSLLRHSPAPDRIMHFFGMTWVRVIKVSSFLQ